MKNQRQKPGLSQVKIKIISLVIKIYTLDWQVNCALNINIKLTWTLVGRGVLRILRLKLPSYSAIFS